MQREKLNVRVRERLRPRIIDPADDAQWEEPRQLMQVNKRIAELEHEIRMIQIANREMCRKAELEGKRIGLAEMKRKTDKIIVELELDNRNLRQQLAKLKQAHASNITPGTQYACPHCGVVTDGPDEEEEPNPYDLAGIAHRERHTMH